MRRALRLLLLVAVVAAGLALRPVQAAPTSPFTKIDAFAIKTGYRGVVAWEAADVVQPVLHFGESASGLDRTASDLGGAPDRSGIVIAEGLTIGKTYFGQLEDRISGTRSEVFPLEARNANSNWDPVAQVYTINLLVQVDTEALPPEVPGDLALSEAAQGMSVFAERVYDATDRHVRIGKVLVTDTNLDYTPNIPFVTPDTYYDTAGVIVGEGVIPPDAPADCRAAGANLADVLLETAPPADSHTSGGFAIAQPCTSFYVGRMGWLRVPTFMWEDDLDFATTAAHEMSHYAFDAPDLYPDSPSGQLTGADCTNPDWDGSLMHNTGRYDKGAHRWFMTELDRNPATSRTPTGAPLTPCTMGLEDRYTWDQLHHNYPNVPLVTSSIDHLVDTQARGAEDGGALVLSILDREPGSSTLTGFTPDDTDLPITPCLPAGPQASDPADDATGVGAEGVLPQSEPGLDILAVTARWDSTARSVRVDTTIKDLTATPPALSAGDEFRAGFDYDGARYQVFADRSSTGAPTFSLRRGDGTTITTGAPLTGSFDAANDVVSVTIPSDGLPAGAPLWTAAGKLANFTAETRRLVPPALAPVADSASGGCGYAFGQERYPDNVAPVAADDTATTPEDQAASIPVTANDADANHDALTVAGVSIAAHGTTAVGPGGTTVVYTPARDFHGTDAFTYVVTDSHGGVASASVVVTVTPTPDAPTAVADAVTTRTGSAIVVRPATNDVHPDGVPFSLATVDDPVWGRVALDGDTVTYTPPAGFTGHDQFRYSVVDADGRTGTGKVSVTVVGPACTTSFSETVDSPTPTEGWTVDVAGAAFFAYADVQTWPPTADPATDSPPFAWFSDATPLTTAQTFKDDRLVSPVIRPLPGAHLSFVHHYDFEHDQVEGDGYLDGGVLEVSTDAGRTWSDIGDRFVGGGYDDVVFADGDNVLAGRAAWVGEHLQPSAVEVDLADFAGQAIQLRWRLATDGNFIALTPGSTGWWVDDIAVNDVVTDDCVVTTPPKARDDASSTNEDTAAVVDVLANDVDTDGDALTITGVGTPAHGAAVVRDGAIRFTPDPDFHGADSFTYTVTDGAGNEATATVALTVTPVNDAPTAADDQLIARGTRPGIVNVLGNDTDVDADSLTLVSVTSPTSGTVTFNPDGTVTYRARRASNGTDRFTYVVADPSGARSTGTVFVETHR